MKLVPYLRRSEAPIVSNLFDEFFRDFPFGGSLLDSREAWIPAVDILEKDDALILRAELPGMTEKGFRTLWNLKRSTRNIKMAY
jgi:HSP20 family molecular chaperone IbpA